MRRDQKPILPSPYDVQILAERFAVADTPRRVTLTPETSQLVSKALSHYASVLASPREDIGFTIDVWDAKGGILENMARASGAIVARAAFDQACKERLGFRVTLRQGIRLVQVRDARPADPA